MPALRRLRAWASHLAAAPHSAPAAPPPALPAAAAGAEEPPIISAENWESWERDGYMVIKNILGEDRDAHCDAVQRDMMALLGWDPDDESTWYTYPGGAMRSGKGSDAPDGQGGGTMLNMWQTQSQWNNRQHPRIYKAFTEIWGTEALWCSIDCADCKPPARDDLPGWGHALGIHCDVEQRMLLGGLAMEPPDAASMNAPWGLRVQGNLYIDDTPPQGGGFRVVAGFHKNYNQWVKQQPADKPLNFSLLDRTDNPDFPVVSVGGQKGDFLLWHSFLPHANGTNVSKKPRMCQYITMWPVDMTYWPTYRTTGDTREQTVMQTTADPDHMRVVADDGTTPAGAAVINEEERQRRITMWRERLPGGCYTWPPVELPDPRAEPQLRPAEPAQLTALGRKLLGLDPWP